MKALGALVGDFWDSLKEVMYGYAMLGCLRAMLIYPCGPGFKTFVRGATWLFGKLADRAAALEAREALLAEARGDEGTPP